MKKKRIIKKPEWFVKKPRFVGQVISKRTLSAVRQQIQSWRTEGKSEEEVVELCVRSYSPMTFGEIGIVLGTSGEIARQAEMRAMRKAREYFARRNQ